MNKQTSYTEKRKEKLKEIGLAKKKYDSLSLIEKNAYQQIIEIKTDKTWLNIPIIPIKGIFYYGIFCIIVSIMGGVNIETFRTSFLMLLDSMIKILIILVPVSIVGQILNNRMINKLKLKLLK